MSRAGCRGQSRGRWLALSPRDMLLWLLRSTKGRTKYAYNIIGVEPPNVGPYIVDRIRGWNWKQVHRQAHNHLHPSKLEVHARLAGCCGFPIKK
eukprot:1147460-Pelagomonas_calceolata.AAC.3